MRNSLAAVLATWFGCGFSPVAPGTVGSIGALVPAFLLARYGGWVPWHFAVLAAAGFLPAAWAAGSYAARMGAEDPGAVVADEVLGQWLALAGATTFNWKSWLAAFLLFRLFDIWKPFPVRRFEKLPGGWGIVADDLAAGAYAALVLRAAGCFNLY